LFPFKLSRTGALNASTINGVTRFVVLPTCSSNACGVAVTNAMRMFVSANKPVKVGSLSEVLPSTGAS